MNRQPKPLAGKARLHNRLEETYAEARQHSICNWEPERRANPTPVDAPMRAHWTIEAAVILVCIAIACIVIAASLEFVDRFAGAL